MIHPSLQIPSIGGFEQEKKSVFPRPYGPIPFTEAVVRRQMRVRENPHWSMSLTPIIAIDV